MIITIISLALIVTTLCLLIQTEWVQNKAAAMAFDVATDYLGSQVSIAHVKVSGLNTIEVDDFCVHDTNQDTLLYIPKTKAKFSWLALLSKEIYFPYAEVQNVDMRLYNDTVTQVLNIRSLVDKLSSNDTLSTEPKDKWTFCMKDIDMQNSTFRYRDALKPFDRPFGMDYADIKFSEIEAQIENLTLLPDSIGGVYMHICHLSCKEQGGLDVRDLETELSVGSTLLEFHNSIIHTKRSYIEAKSIDFAFGSFANFSDNFFELVGLDFQFTKTHLALEEVALFAPYFNAYEGRTLDLAGNLTGTLANLNASNINVSFGNNTKIVGECAVKGLPELRSSFFFVDIDSIQTCPADIELIRTGAMGESTIRLPKTIHKFKQLAFNGNFTGFYDDFVTYGTFDTNLGKLKTDLSIKPQQSLSDTTFTFRGAIAAIDFQLGQLLEQSAIGRVTMDGDVVGAAASSSDVHADLNGRIRSIRLLDYTYRNIKLDGRVNNRTYDGQLAIDEKNIKLNFSGMVDLNDKLPEYAFEATVERAHLNALKLVEQDTSAFAAFEIEAKFTGTNVDNFAGDLELHNVNIRRRNREMELNELLIFTKVVQDTNRYVLQSDVLNASIWGEYQLLDMGESLMALLKNYSPAWGDKKLSPDKLSNNNFGFSVSFKDTEKLSAFLLDDFRLGQDAKIKGFYNPGEKDFRINVDIPFMRWQEQRYRNVKLRLDTQNSNQMFLLDCQRLRLNQSMSFENLSILANAAQDSLNLGIRWQNSDSLNAGELLSRIFFIRRDKESIPSIHVFTDTGRVVLAGDEWDIQHKGVSIYGSQVNVHNMVIAQPSQQVYVDGVVSERDNDSLSLRLNNLQLSLINKIFNFEALGLQGLATGRATLSQVYQQTPLFLADVDIKDFALNDIPLGFAHLRADWQGESKSVGLDLQSNHKLETMVKAHGQYYTDDGSINLAIETGRLSAQFLDPYLSGIFNDVDGYMQAKLNLSGALTHPLFNGQVELFEPSLQLDFTGVRYKLSGIAEFKDSRLYFDKVRIRDRFNGEAISSGYVSMEDFSNIQYKLGFKTNSLEVLKTTLQDNADFYGTAYASADVRLEGNQQELKLDILGKTLKNTQFAIPIAETSEVSRSSFIHFTDHSVKTDVRPVGLSRRRRALTTTVADTESTADQEMQYRVRIGLEATPEAEVQLIFDSQIGDIIKARGIGNLEIMISNTDFTMQGGYTIESGDYLFTLPKMLVNKKFSLMKGGQISWTGDPLEAVLNLQAVYNAKPPLQDLVQDPTMRRNVPVECLLAIAGRMSSPSIGFDINLPNADQEVRSFLTAATATEEEKTKQFLSLLVMNRFFINQDATSMASGAGSGLEFMGLATASEFLTNQLSYMMSQWSDKIDVDFSYTPGSELSGQNVGMDLTTDLWRLHFDYDFNNREAANGNGNQIGDVSLDFKVGKSDKLRFKVFYRSEDRYFENRTGTQGVGLTYREEFDKWSSLLRRKSKKNMEEK